MKRILLIAMLVLASSVAFAQKGSVTATVVDAETGEGIAGAVLTVAPVAAPERAQHLTSGYQGSVAIRALAYGEYSLVVSFLGYNNLETKFKVEKATFDLGRLELKSGVAIETVVKEAKAIRASQKGDTISYNAGAFKVANDADVEGLQEEDAGYFGLGW